MTVFLRSAVVSAVLVGLCASSSNASTLVTPELTLVSQRGTTGGDPATGEIKSIARSDGSDQSGAHFSGLYFQETGFSYGDLSYVFENTGTTAISFAENTLSYRSDATAVLQNLPGVDAQNVAFNPGIFVSVMTDPSNTRFTVWSQELYSSHRVGTIIGGRAYDTVNPFSSRIQAGQLVLDNSVVLSDDDDLAALNVGSQTRISQSDETGFDVTLAIGAFTVQPGQFLSINANLNLSAAAEAFSPLPSNVNIAATIDATNTASLFLELPDDVVFRSAVGRNPDFVTGGSSTVTVSPVPLPASCGMLITALVGLGWMLRRRGY